MSLVCKESSSLPHSNMIHNVFIHSSSDFYLTAAHCFTLFLGMWLCFFFWFLAAAFWAPVSQRKGWSQGWWRHNCIWKNHWEQRLAPDLASLPQETPMIMCVFLCMCMSYQHTFLWSTAVDSKLIFVVISVFFVICMVVAAHFLSAWQCE